MNVFEQYENYSTAHIKEFKMLLNNVSRSLLSMTEKIPKEELLEVFKNDMDRQYLNISEGRERNDFREGYLFLGFGGLISIGQYPYDMGPLKELDQFMESFYPGIECNHNYMLDLYSKAVEFEFGFSIEFCEEDFEEKNHTGRYRTVLKKAKKHKDVSNSLSLFNDDITVILQCKYDTYEWFALNKYFDSDKIETGYYESGITFVKLPFIEN